MTLLEWLVAFVVVWLLAAVIDLRARVARLERRDEHLPSAGPLRGQR
jgi:hypothetical protein